MGLGASTVPVLVTGLLSRAFHLTVLCACMTERDCVVPIMFYRTSLFFRHA